MKTVIALIAICLTVAGTTIAQATSSVAPVCPEDAVLVGHGQYANGEWSKYSCVPLDDIAVLRIDRSAPSLQIHGYVKVSPQIVLKTPAVRYSNVVDHSTP